MRRMFERWVVHHKRERDVCMDVARYCRMVGDRKGMHEHIEQARVHHVNMRNFKDCIKRGGKHA